jgi:hypothetical protein
MPFCVVVAKGLDALTDHAADQRPFEWLAVIDGSARHGSDDRTARLTVVVTIGVIARVMIRLREHTSGRQKEREAQQCRLDFFVSHLDTPTLI